MHGKRSTLAMMSELNCSRSEHRESRDQRKHGTETLARNHARPSVCPQSHITKRRAICGHALPEPRDVQAKPPLTGKETAHTRQERTFCFPITCAACPRSLRLTETKKKCNGCHCFFTCATGFERHLQATKSETVICVCACSSGVSFFVTHQKFVRTAVGCLFRKR